MHVRTISETGGEILGFRSLELDKISMPILLSAMGGEGTTILNGAHALRPAHRTEWGTLPVLGYWGSDFIVSLAEKLAESRASAV